MDAKGSSPLSNNMTYAATHAMFYLVVGFHHIQHMSGMEQGHAMLLESEAKLKHQVAELERNAHGFEKKYDIMMVENMSLDEILSVLWIP